MHVFFSGIGGAGIGPLALIAHQAGFEVSGSDKQDSQYIQYLKKHGIADINIGQTRENIAKVYEAEPIDWYVYSSAVLIENPGAPEFAFCREQNIKMTKRDEFINLILKEKNLKLIAVAGTHGKTTTTAMTIWLFKQLKIPVSYSVGGKIPFGAMGQVEAGSEYFVYEADEFDRNFLSFHPHLAVITGIDWDHPDIYPTRESYNEAFREFLGQSQRAVLWRQDLPRLAIEASSKQHVVDEDDTDINSKLTLPGLVNRQNAWEVAQAVQWLTAKPLGELIAHLDKFPGVSRRFEQIAPNLYTDYAHTPSKIRGALQLAHEVASDNVVVVYEGLHNTRQHFIKDDLRHLFDEVKKLYVVPSYLAREDKNLPLLLPADLRDLLDTETQTKTEPANLNVTLKSNIRTHLTQNDLVLCLSAGGGHSLDEWLRREFAT
ncbi:MAG TPA: Mur ligase domain-containing protein [Candidatus Saccharimonadales bacterium]|jgi:UDP-N-acetylmuramate--alanine ligase